MYQLTEANIAAIDAEVEAFTTAHPAFRPVLQKLQTENAPTGAESKEIENLLDTLGETDQSWATLVLGLIGLKVGQYVVHLMDQDLRDAIRLNKPTILVILLNMVEDPGVVDQVTSEAAEHYGSGTQIPKGIANALKDRWFTLATRRP